MKNLKDVIKKLNFFQKNKKSKNQTSSFKTYRNGSFLNDHNKEILKRFKKPVIQDFRERKKVFIEVKEHLCGIEPTGLRNGDFDD